MPRVEPKTILQHFPMASRARGQVWQHQPAFRRPRHFHPEMELNFVTRGEARMSVGQEVAELVPGSLIWFIPGQSHELLAASAELELWVVGATPGFAERVGGARVGPCHRCLAPSASAELDHRCRATLEGTYDASSEEAVGAILDCANAGAAGEHPACFDPLVARALRYLLIQPTSSRTSLARQLRVSEAELSRRFHAQVGIPFQQYRHRIRVMQAIQRLGHGERSFLQAALEAGFGSYSQCFRAFEQVVGCSPSSYWRVGRKMLENAVAEAAGGP
jgi:methylphosphotriester-DNA--protein-cysteine methyltransferase/mannose-6-phosphate isomerase-like protein (cupin superfamily)